jgi:hypothetical protein
MPRTYKTAGPGGSHDDAVTEPIRLATKIAILLREDLELWQRLNVTAFLASGIAGHEPDVVGEDYTDAAGVRYLPMFRQPVMVFTGDQATVRAAHERALRRGMRPAIFTAELFKTGNDRDNRAAVRAVGTADLDLVGIALHGPRNAVDKVLKGASLHI